MQIVLGEIVIIRVALAVGSAYWSAVSFYATGKGKEGKQKTKTKSVSLCSIPVWL